MWFYYHENFNTVGAMSVFYLIAFDWPPFSLNIFSFLFSVIADIKFC